MTDRVASDGSWIPMVSGKVHPRVHPAPFVRDTRDLPLFRRRGPMSMPGFGVMLHMLGPGSSIPEGAVGQRITAFTLDAGAVNDIRITLQDGTVSAKIEALATGPKGGST